MRKYGRFSEETVKSFTRQVLEGLAYLHGTGILHRVWSNLRFMPRPCLIVLLGPERRQHPA